MLSTFYQLFWNYVPRVWIVKSESPQICPKKLWNGIFYRQFTYKNQQRHSTTLTYIFIFSKGRQVESVSIMTTLIKHCRLIHYSIWLWKRWQVLTQSHSLLPLSLYCFLTVLLFPYYLCGQKLKPIHQVIITVSPLHSTPIINYTSTLMNSIKKLIQCANASDITVTNYQVYGFNNSCRHQKGKASGLLPFSRFSLTYPFLRPSIPLPSPPSQLCHKFSWEF